MRAFKTGGIDVVGNCDLISEGFDAPACEVVIMGAPTRSITRFLQMAGRAMRYDYANPAKTALAIDLAEICRHLGLPDEPREWSLEDGEIQARRERRKLPLRTCSCLTAYRQPPCPSCGAAPTLANIVEVETELVEATEKGATKRQPKTTKRQRASVMASAISADSDDAARKIVVDFNRSVGYKPNYMLAYVMKQRNGGW